MDKTIKKLPKGSRIARSSMARLAAVQCIYQWLQTQELPKNIIHYYMAHYEGLEEDGETFLTPDPQLLSAIVLGVKARFDDVERITKKSLHEQVGDHESRKDLLIICILYCGIYELMAHQEIDPPVIISDYLHVTRAFYEGAETKLVNAVLDALKPAFRL